MRETNLHPEVWNIQNKMSDNLITSEDDAIKILKIWNRTDWNNASVIDIIDYKQLIFFELFFEDNMEIQQLINILKESIKDNYVGISQRINFLADFDYWKQQLKPEESERLYRDRGLNLYIDSRSFEEGKAHY